VTPEPSICFRATATRIIDGDTIECEIRRTIHVRLRNIDCPERNTPDGQKAKQFVEETLDGKEVIVYIPTDKHGNALMDFTSFERVVGDIWFEYEKNGKKRTGNLATALLMNGFTKDLGKLPILKCELE